MQAFVMHLAWSICLAAVVSVALGGGADQVCMYVYIYIYIYLCVRECVCLIYIYGCVCECKIWCVSKKCIIYGFTIYLTKW